MPDSDLRLDHVTLCVDFGWPEFHDFGLQQYHCFEEFDRDSSSFVLPNIDCHGLATQDSGESPCFLHCFFTRSGLAVLNRIMLTADTMIGELWPGRRLA